MLMHVKACNIPILSYYLELYAQLSNEAGPLGDKTFMPKMTMKFIILINVNIF